jgi:hypothetical protein
MAKAFMIYCFFATFCFFHGDDTPDIVVNLGSALQIWRYETDMKKKWRR